MRRILGGLALTLGILALVLGIRASWVYDQLAKLPLDQRTTAVSEGTGVSGTLLSAPDGKTIKVDPFTNATVRNTREVIGIPGRVEESRRDDNAFWELGLSTEVVGRGVLKQTIDGVSIDRRTGMATNCCTDFMSAGTLADPGAMVEMQHKGLFFTFPLDAQKQSYPFWDADLMDSRDAAFVRTETVKGLDTYVYEQVIPTTELKRTATTVPRSVFGGGTGSVPAHQTYANTRTFWVEPATGVIIRAQENIDKKLVSDAGTITLLKGVIGYTDQTQQQQADDYAGKARALKIVNGSLRPLGLLLGTLLSLAGLALLFSGRREPGRHLEGATPRTGASVREEQPYEPVAATGSYSAGAAADDDRTQPLPEATYRPEPYPSRPTHPDDI